jgi:hypothetical protein
MGEFEAVWSELERFLEVGFLKGGSEKGCTRNRTGNRVASWRFMFWGNLRDSR